MSIFSFKEMMNREIIYKFFVRVMLYLLPVLLCMLGMEVLQRNLPNDYSYKKQQLELKLPEIETLIMGTSHTYMGINPSLLEGNAFNFASTAQSLYFDKFLFEKYHQQMPRLKRIILPVSYSSLGSESYLNPGEYNKSYHYAYFYGSTAFIKPLAPRRFSLVSLFSVKRSVDRSLGYYFEQEALVECDELGWYKGTEGARDLQRNGEDAGKFHDLYYDDNLIPQNTAYLSEIIRTCKENNIAVYLVSMPMYTSYMDHVSPDRYDRMVTVVDSLSQAHELTYLNHTLDTDFHPEHFFDSNHLNESGAALFTHKLQQHIQAFEQGSPLISDSH